MLDNNALQQLVEQQAQKEVADKIQQIMNEQWFKTVETNAIKFIQDRIVAKFANSDAMPELVDAVKTSVQGLFSSGKIPGVEQYVDYDLIKQGINDSTQELVYRAIAEMSLDKVWLEKIERIINKQTADRVTTTLATIDIRPIIEECVNNAVAQISIGIFKGMQSLSESVELTILDENVVVENNLTAKDIIALKSLTVNDLSVKGSINTDNHSWNDLADHISKKTFDKLNDQWKDSLVSDVKDSIVAQGIDFDNVKIDGSMLINNGILAKTIVNSNLQSVGTLEKLNVKGEVSLSDTMFVNNKRIGVNTDTPDMALSVWDEEISLSAGKFKSQVGFIGTTRKQGLVIGVNKIPAIDINDQGVTTIKQLQVGFFKITHGTEVPNYSGTKGDIVFNSSPTIDNPVFAWQCLGGFKWKVIRAVE